jgi:DNA-binding NtrC family response regulator
LKILMNHDWLGNVRELENAVERAIVTCKARILAEEDFGFLNNNHSHEKKAWTVPSDMTLDEAENQIIGAALRRAHGNIKEAASILGIDRSTLYDKIKKYNLPRE